MDSRPPADGRCGTCRHWTPYFGFQSYPRLTRLPLESPAQHEQRQAEASSRYRRCQAVASTPEDFEPAAYVVDSSEELAELFTTAEFGCTMYEFDEATVTSDEEDQVR